MFEADQANIPRGGECTLPTTRYPPQTRQNNRLRSRRKRRAGIRKTDRIERNRRMQPAPDFWIDPETGVVTNLFDLRHGKA